MNNNNALEEKIGRDEFREIKELLRNNVKSIIAVVCVCAAVVVVLVFQRVRARGEIQASQMLSSARSVRDLETVIERHPSTAAAPLSLLRLAKAHYNSGNYDVASGKYDEFKQRFPDHQMVKVAELGKIHCLETRGQLEGALSAFTAFSTEHPAHFLRHQAFFGRARCLSRLGRMKEAKALYEDFIAAYPESGWLPRVEEELALITKKIERAPEVVPGDGPQKPIDKQQETTFDWGGIGK